MDTQILRTLASESADIILRELQLPETERDVCYFEPYSLWAVAEVCAQKGWAQTREDAAREIQTLVSERRPVDWLIMSLAPTHGVLYCAQAALKVAGLGSGPIRDEDFEDRLRLAQAAQSIKQDIESRGEGIDQAKRRITPLIKDKQIRQQLEQSKTLGVLALRYVQVKENI